MAAAATTPELLQLRVEELFLYPVKGCRGIPLAAATVTPTGVALDRHWMVVREDGGKFVTQRQLPRLALVATALPPEALLGEGWGRLQPGAALELSAPGMAAPLHVPLTPASASASSSEPAAALPAGAALRTVTVWEWTGTAVDEGDEAAAWLSEYLGKAVRLVRHIGRASLPGGGQGAPTTVRPTDPAFAAGHEVKFADGFPLLVTRQENLADLNTRLAAPLPMNRFRPNIVLSGGGAAPWADDAWRQLRFGGGAEAGAAAAGVQVQLCKPCSRCKVTTIDQATAEEGKEPLATLRTFRSGQELGYVEQHGRSWTHEVFFGLNAAVLQTGAIRVGDPVTVSASA